MSVPGSVRDGVEQALAGRDLGGRIVSGQPVGGGCINHGARLETDTGAVVFLKWNTAAPPGMFEAEIEGLRALRRGLATAFPASTPPARVPEPYMSGNTADGIGWLLMEHVTAGAETRDGPRRLGRALAGLHARSGATSGETRPPGASARAGAALTFGWESDNWIGSLPQRNDRADEWGEFWRDHRIAPQLALARARGFLDDELFDRLLQAIPSALGDVEDPELLHGDLWGGNWFADERGTPVLIDPAVYRGHGEVDLAMSELFGGFPSGFYDAYREARGISDAYGAFRRDLYQLYYLLVHVNLFGGSYVAGSSSAARRVLAEIG